MLHKFEFDGSKIVLDVHSGAVHVVDGLAWELLDDCCRMDKDEILQKYRGRYSRDLVVQCLDEIEELRRGGLLFSQDFYRGKYNPPGAGVVKSLCLHLAHACNLRCRYCFAGQGNFGGPEELMPADIGRRAIDLLIDRSGGRKRLEVDFFGGEPLLNFEVLKELVDYSRRRGGENGKEFSFTVTTNAVLLNEEIGEYLNKHGINVVLSLDGRPEVHDAMRPAPGGRGSYDSILPRIKRFVNSRAGSETRVAKGAYTIVRGTYTRHNLDFCADVLHMADLGFDRVSVEPVVAPEEDGYSIRREDLPVLFSQYEQLTRALLQRRQAGRPVDYFHFNIDLEGGPCLPKRLSGCGAGHEYLAVAPNGDIYPCHQFVGRSAYLMGNVKEGQVDTDIAATFRRAHIYNKEGCVDCWAKFYCSGGCHANAELFNGSIFKPYALGCELIKKRLECALYLKVKDSILS
ncbi:MAG: thioether cross-link-forming SCIFF peptide maturase [Desulfotomaculaceae bacterium]|nr:thioether cross-link-forming SCIFF peptide maturase [Desulfotomaculaceae bacterium]